MCGTGRRRHGSLWPVHPYSMYSTAPGKDCKPPLFYVYLIELSCNFAASPLTGDFKVMHAHCREQISPSDLDNTEWLVSAFDHAGASVSTAQWRHSSDEFVGLAKVLTADVDAFS